MVCRSCRSLNLRVKSSKHLSNPTDTPECLLILGGKEKGVAVYNSLVAQFLFYFLIFYKLFCTGGPVFAELGSMVRFIPKCKTDWFPPCEAWPEHSCHWKEKAFYRSQWDTSFNSNRCRVEGQARAAITFECGLNNLMAHVHPGELDLNSTAEFWLSGKVMQFASAVVK